MSETDNDRWREKVRLCAIAIRLFPIAPAGDCGWYVREYERATLELRYFPLAADSQAMYLIKAFRLNVRQDGRGHATVKWFSDEAWGGWHPGINKAVVDYVAAHAAEMLPHLGVPKSEPT